MQSHFPIPLQQLCCITAHLLLNPFLVCASIPSLFFFLLPSPYLILYLCALRYHFSLETTLSFRVLLCYLISHISGTKKPVKKKFRCHIQIWQNLQYPTPWKWNILASKLKYCSNILIANHWKEWNQINMSAHTVNARQVWQNKYKWKDGLHT